MTPARLYELQHLLGANYWVQPIYQELLRAASGHNASVAGERKRPCSGLVKIMAKQRQTKTRAPDVNTACVTDWIGGLCPADSMMIWFPAHWAAQVIEELERREQDHRQRFPQWFDGRIPNKYRQQYQEARASRTLQFQKRPYLESPIELLTASIRDDWFSLPVQSFLDRMPHLRQGLIRGSFRPRHPPRGVVISQNVSKSPCVCPIKEILIHGMRRCIHCQLHGLMSLISTPTISRRLPPTSFLPFAPRWVCLTCGERYHPNGTYSAITSGILAPVTMQGD